MKTEEKNMDLSRMLLDWYYAERRILPWREDPTPYHVWISEIMLQQTRVEAVKEYYRRFLEALPDVRALAEAEEQEYLKLWEGLGYYSRVRNMHKAAVQIMEEYDGQIPGNSKDLEKLPGIGSYTAAAIASIAFGERKPSVDGNLLRVYARMTCSDENILAAGTKKKAEEWYWQIIPEIKPGDFNQAVMDIGATICLPNTEPKCLLCPWREACRSYAEGTQMKYPVRIKKMKKKTEKRTIFLIEDGSKVFLSRRPATGLLAGLYEFPGAEGHLSEEEALERAAACGIRIDSIERLPDAKHVFSHVTWNMRGYRIQGTWNGASEKQKADSDSGEVTCSKKTGSAETEFRTESSVQEKCSSYSASNTGEAASADLDRSGTGIFAVERSDLEERYPVPAAFDAYRKLLKK